MGQILCRANLWKKGKLVTPIKIPGRLRTDEFYLGDFGLAKELSHPETPRACDMWSYMVVFAMLYMRFSPISSYHEGGIVGGMFKCLGPLPAEWKGCYTHGEAPDSWYDQSQTCDPEYNLESEIARFSPDSDPVERGHVLSIMSRVFTYDPERRLTASQLLRDPSFRAIMDKYGC
ncbi:hypothetical protein BDW62DRAFT_214837 [Aspergillus aurantiobrunneus]